MRYSTEHNFVSNIIRHPDELANIFELVPEIAITDDRLRHIYSTVIALWSAGEPVNEVTIYKTAKPDAVFLSQLTDKVPSKQEIPWLAGDIAKEYHRSRLERYIKDLAEINKTYDPHQVLNHVSKMLSEEIHLEKKDNSSRAAVERHTETQERNAEHGLGLNTGFMCYDDKWITYCPNHVWVIGGFTSVGKTAKMVEMLYRGHTVNDDFKSVVISTEMTETQMINRLIARVTKLSQNYIMSGKIKSEHIKLVDDAKTLISNWNMTIYDSVYELGEVEMCVRKKDLQGGVDIVFIDYAQNMTVEGAKSEYQENNAIAKRIQKLAKAHLCTIVLFSQLSNDAAKDDQGILQFKGAGTYSAIADLGIILRKSKEEEDVILEDCGKNRHGARYKQALQYVDNWSRLKETWHKENA